MKTNFSLKAKILFLITACLISSSLTTMGLLLWTDSKVDSLLSDATADIENLQALRKIQLAFAREVQEWKDTLLRGADPEMYKKYSAAFDKSVEDAFKQAQDFKTKLSPEEQKLVDRFLEAQTTLKEEYVAARSQYVNGTIFEPSKADKQVKGKDRKVLESLNQLAETISTNAEKDRQSSREALAFLLKTGLMISLALALFFMAIGWFFTGSVSRRLNEITKMLSGSSTEVTSASSVLQNASLQASNGSSESASSLEETVASLEELTSMVKASSENAVQASQLSEQSTKTAKQGEQAMSGLRIAIQEIVQSSKKIEEIINIIDDIAFQTNLLALNAAVEAARAGEQGKGFSVVAEAVRNLAQRSADAAKDIHRLIKESVEQIERGHQMTETSNDLLKSIVVSIQKVFALNNEIANASSEQSTGIQQISQAMTVLDSVTQQNAATAETVADSAGTLSQQSKSLHEVVQNLAVLVQGKNEISSFDQVGVNSFNQGSTTVRDRFKKAA